MKHLVLLLFLGPLTSPSMSQPLEEARHLMEEGRLQECVRMTVELLEAENPVHTRHAASALLAEAFDRHPSSVARELLTLAEATVSSGQGEAVARVLATRVSGLDFATDVRGYAALTLQQTLWGGSETVHFLHEVLKDDSAHPTVKADALSVIGRYGEVAPEALQIVLEALEDGDVERQVAVVALGDIGPAAFNEGLPVLKSLIERSKNPIERRQAVVAVGKVAVGRGHSALPILVPLLELDPDTGVRVAAAQALRLVAAPEAVEAIPHLLNALQSPDADLSEQAALGLAAFGRPAVEPLIGMLREGAPQAKRAALMALARLGPKAEEAAPVLCQMLDSALQEEVARTLGAIGPGAAEAAPLLTELLSTASTSGPYIQALVGIGEPAVPALVIALRGDQSQLRFRAAAALGSLGSAAIEAVPALIGALGDHDSFVRERAALALGQVGDDSERVRSSLEARLSDDSSEVQVAAQRALMMLDN